MSNDESSSERPDDASNSERSGDSNSEISDDDSNSEISDDDSNLIVSKKNKTIKMVDDIGDGVDLTDIIIDKINNNYSRGRYIDFNVIIMNDNSYINCTKLCRDLSKKKNMVEEKKDAVEENSTGKRKTKSTKKENGTGKRKTKPAKKANVIKEVKSWNKLKSAKRLIASVCSIVTSSP